MASSVRDKIVEAALERFHALGFSACGVQEIVDKAGVPKGSFYNYFKSKELLAVEVLEVYAKGSRREMLADKSVAPVKRLRAHFEFLASRYAGFGYSKGCLIGSIAAETSDHMPIVRKALAQGLANWTKLVAAAIREGQADGSIEARLDADHDFFSVTLPLFTRPVHGDSKSAALSPKRGSAVSSSRRTRSGS